MTQESLQRLAQRRLPALAVGDRHFQAQRHITYRVTVDTSSIRLVIYIYLGRKIAGFSRKLEAFALVTALFCASLLAAMLHEFMPTSRQGQ